MKKVIIAISCLVLVAGSFNKANAQIISTIAGTGVVDTLGDGGPATAATLQAPNAIKCDAHGNIYIADNNRVRKIDTAGVITTVAGKVAGGYSGDGGPATAATFFYVDGLAFDAAGNLYISEGGNSTIRKVNASGIISTIAGSNTPGFSGDGGNAVTAQLAGPGGIAFDAAGNLYIADISNNRIRKVTPAGIISTFAGTGTPGYTGDGGAATAAGLKTPGDVIADAAGNIYIADQGNNVIRKVNTSGIISTIAGDGGPGYVGDGGPATAAQLNFPRALAMDGQGNLFIAELLNSVIRKVAASGTISTVVGDGQAAYNGDGGPATAAELNIPQGVAFDSCGNMYISDYSNYRVRKVTYNNCNLAVHEVPSHQTLTLYPNPTQNPLTITGSAKITALSITNLLGQKIYAQTCSSTKAVINTSFMHPGTYFVTITTTAGQVVKKVVKE